MKKDNTTFRRKVSLRLNALAELERPEVVETHGGRGLLYARCYADLPAGVVFEKDESRACGLARARPTWAVYHADSAAALAAGVGFHRRPNFFDVDPHGECWPTVRAIFAGMTVRVPKLVLCVNCGLRQKLKLQGGWSVKTLREVIERRGNASLYADYLDICREMVTRTASAAGYGLVRWTGYYCGALQGMTHYAAILELGTRG